jgi:DNA repair photolyase
LGANTDPYQPIEREYKITRSLLDVLNQCRHPLTIVTKSRLILRDMDILLELAVLNLVKVFISVTTLDAELARKMEPRASTPQRRVETIRTLSEAGIPVGFMFTPIIPCVNDAEMESILDVCVEAGGVLVMSCCGYRMSLRPCSESVWKSTCP